jgi:hypothetical protein
MMKSESSSRVPMVLMMTLRPGPSMGRIEVIDRTGPPNSCSLVICQISSVQAQQLAGHGHLNQTPLGRRIDRFPQENPRSVPNFQSICLPSLTRSLRFGMFASRRRAACPSPRPGPCRRAFLPSPHFALRR